VSLVTELVCVRCGRPAAPAGPWTCPDCGPDEGILDVRYDLARARRTLTRESLAARPAAHWRYRELLPLEDAYVPAGGAPLPVGAGLSQIGWTPVIDAPRLAAALGVARLRLKDEGRNASGSFKDRASSVGVAHAAQLGRGEIACASTGNAASSLACCAAAAGMPCNIFVPRQIPEAKLAQLLAYGARVFRVGGTYADAYQLCSRAAARFGWYNRNCAINPYLVEGKKTAGCEIAEQCADDPPDWVAVSVGDGCTVAGVHKGLRQMAEAGWIGWSARMLGVQAAGVAPVAEAWGKAAAGAALGTLTGRELTPGGDTYADSINCPAPRNWRKAVLAVRESNGAFVTVRDEEIRGAVRLAGRLAGVFAEPAAAAAVAGVAAAVRDRVISDTAHVLAIVTGSGLKDVAGAMRAVGGPHDVRPDPGEIERIVLANTR